MNTLKLLGISGDKKYKAWKEQTLLTLLSTNINAKLEEINDVDEIISYNIKSIPALLLNNKLILKQNNQLPDRNEIESAIIESLQKKQLKMKKIIVPTDFSEVSKNAYQYAKDLSEELEADIKAVHIFHPEALLIDGISTLAFDEIENERLETLDEFVHTKDSEEMDGLVKEELIEKEVITGFPPDTLIRLSAQENVDMILMGTRKKANLIDQVLGSVSSQTAQKAECPVWLIPPDAKYKPIQNILYASDFESANKKMVDQMIDFAGTFDANIHMVHVHKESWKGDPKFENHILEQLFRKNGGGVEFRMTTVKSTNAWQGLYDYAAEHEIDLIVLTTKQRSFWDNLFHKSITKQMVLNAQLPLVVFHQNY